MTLARRDNVHNTYGDYLAWPEHVRYELIDGSAYLMVPAHDLLHQEIAGEIYRQLSTALIGAQCRVFIAPLDVRLPRAAEANDKIDTVVQPRCARGLRHRQGGSSRRARRAGPGGRSACSLDRRP